ncbi:NAD-dependent epimerase/dehydratase family protein, partial [Lacticaseibacillus rhamnosus]
MEGAVFVQTNAAHNEVITFSRGADGSLARAGEFATGGAGFIGSHLVDRLVADGHEVVVADNLSTGRPDNLARHAGNPRLTLHRLDVTEPGALTGVFDDVKWAFHLAALADIVPSIVNPRAYFEVNVDGTLNVLETARAAGVVDPDGRLRALGILVSVAVLDVASPRSECRRTFHGRDGLGVRRK